MPERDTEDAVSIGAETHSHSDPTKRRASHIPGEGGVWIFIFGDMCVFAVLFVVFLHARQSDPAAFARDQAHLNANFGAINTVLLLVSSLFVVLAMRAVTSRAHSALAPRFIAAAWVCGLGFLVIKAIEYTEKIRDHITPQTSEFFMYYFVLTGLHAFHLLLGLAVLVVLYGFAKKSEMSGARFAFFEGGACFWHMVDLLWIVLFPLIFLVR
ncbi:cytochrome c oxidase subunit 3 family protein [Mycobacterium hodleri]|uniref:Probable cytochrome c oxidase subunit 3 n=2 Tax=Mycolicibacterium hodleri TaxID=49897 RepID=A0A502E7Z6_9MYCO|nr:cytochrome c oxidase subunit 3 family protein [Mycolicibacterium hodleri]